MSNNPVDLQALPVVVIGSGPIGLAAAAHLARRERAFVILEAGSEPAAAVRAWSHVTLFTPWGYVVDPEAGALLTERGWSAPEPDLLPTGDDLLRQYLEPLARHPAITPHLLTGHRVTAVSRHQLGKLEEGRDEHPFLVESVRADGSAVSMLACGVIDASGTWNTPNPLGANGREVPGEAAARDHIAYGIPDVMGTERSRYAGRRTLVVGAGHSAFHLLRQLVQLGEDEPGTEVHWAIRRLVAHESLAVCADDELTERTLIRQDIAGLLSQQAIQAHPGTRITGIHRGQDGLVAQAGDITLPPVDEIVVATGFRPDHTLARELRLDVHSVFESTYELAPLIDPDVSACGTVPPHGVAHLAHPEPDYYIVGAKSYGRAPTFLLYAGYEQVRSAVCALDGDEAALEVRLQLPERGLCSACTAFLDARDAAAGCGCGEGTTDVCCDDEPGSAEAA